MSLQKYLVNVDLNPIKLALEEYIANFSAPEPYEDVEEYISQMDVFEVVVNFNKLIDGLSRKDQSQSEAAGPEA